MSAAVIIPARYASTRLPGKLLLADTGKPLVQHTYEQAKQAQNADAVIVATDDARIARAVEAFGGAVVMTARHHETGTARVAEAAAQTDADIIVNLQGDEPEIDPADIDRLIDAAADVACFAATLVCPFDLEARAGPGSPEDTAAVKAILGEEMSGGVFRARYFTRSICAYPRDAEGRIIDPQRYHLHIG
ncbi:MAG: cytidylyltransferase domain-containing protein, partial [Hyphococcus sp.]